jgi:hypothetical protein
MKPRLSNKRNRALTLVEAIVVLALIAVLLAMLLPTLDHTGPSPRIPCVNNLKEIGTAYRIWANDNGDKYPMQISVTNGGTMGLVITGNVAACFQVMSNELNTPKILVCPQDTKRSPATSFSRGFNNDNVSYFVGLDVTNDTNPQMFLSGDDNFAISGVPVKSGLLELSTNAPIAWTAARHKFIGNICLADGSVQQLTTDDLQKALQQTGVATNRLVIP